MICVSDGLRGMVQEGRLTELGEMSDTIKVGVLSALQYIVAVERLPSLLLVWRLGREEKSMKSQSAKH
jgi:hypothetical protein